MESFLVSISVVALAEIGDKTQLLALVLAAKFRKPRPIALGILMATIANHALAGAVGASLTSIIDAQTLRWILGASFLAMAAWTLVPDRFDGTHVQAGRLGVFGATFAAFFLIEMGDKTQIATVALAAQYGTLWIVVVGTTLGMMVANVPAVIIGDRMAHRLPIKLIRCTAAMLFALLGIAALLGIGQAT